MNSYSIPGLWSFFSHLLLKKPKKMSFVIQNFNKPGSHVTVTVPDHVSDKPVSEEKLKNFKPFQTWLDTLKSSLARQTDKDHPFHENPYSLRSVQIQSIDWFDLGPDKPPKIGFVKLEGLIQNSRVFKDGKWEIEKLPGVAFLRGGSAAALMILRPNDMRDEKWVVMTEQPRIPAGSLTFMEIPAGMLDEEENFKGKVVDEIREETSLEVPQHELIDMTALAVKGYKSPEGLQPAMYPSPGGCDEFINIFLWEKELDRQEIEDLRDKLTGLRTQTEKITLRILPYEELWRVGARDAKTLAAWSLYESLKRARLIP
jgi:ADP-sugar diphosphatase